MDINTLNDTHETRDALSNYQDVHPAWNISESNILGIPQKNKIRKDFRQVLYYGALLMDSWCIRLVPAQVVVLSLFDGHRTLGEVAQCLAYLSDSNYQEALLKIRVFLKWIDFSKDNRMINITDRRGWQTKQFNSRDFLIPETYTQISIRLDKPVTLLLMPTDRCQTNCIYCYACRRQIPYRELLSIKRIHELIDEAAGIGVCLVNLDGGDVMCRKECVEIIAHLCEHDMVPVVSTKAHISKEKAQQLHRAGLRYIQVSLDAPTPEMADYLVRRPGFFDRTIKSIYSLVEAGITTRTNSIITAESLHLLPRLVDFLMTLPLNNIKVAPTFGSLYRGNENILLSPEEKKWYRIQMKRAEEKYPGRGINWECTDDVLDLSPEERKARFQKRPLCSSGRTQMVITPDGKVNLCEQSPQGEEFICGDVSYQSIEEVWNSKSLKEMYCMPRERFNGTACYDCGEFEKCVHERGHCFIQSLKTYDTAYAPNPDCHRAPLPTRRWQ